MTKDTTNSLSHTRWKCKYHLVFAPKFRRQIVYGKIREDVGRILRTLCEQKKVEIHEAEACPDHIHMLVSIPPHLSVAQFVGYLKGKSSLMIFDRHANLKYKYGNRHFWCRGYFVDTVGANKNAIAEYIRHQLDEDIAYEQLSLKEYFDPFTGGKNKQVLTTTGRLCKNIFKHNISIQSKPPAQLVVLIVIYSVLFTIVTTRCGKGIFNPAFSSVGFTAAFTCQ